MEIKAGKWKFFVCSLETSVNTGFYNPKRMCNKN